MKLANKKKSEEAKKKTPKVKEAKKKTIKSDKVSPKAKKKNNSVKNDKLRVKSKYRKLYLNTEWDGRILTSMEYYCKPNQVTYNNFVKFEDYISNIGNLDDNHSYLIDINKINQGLISAKKVNNKDKEYTEYCDYKKIYKILSDANIPIFNSGIPSIELDNWNIDNNPSFTKIIIHGISYLRINEDEQDHLLHLITESFPYKNRKWRIDKSITDDNMLIIKSFDRNDDIKLAKDYANFINYEIARIRSNHQNLHFSHVDIKDTIINEDGKVIQFSVDFIEGHNLYDMNNLRFFVNSLVAVMRDNDFYYDWRVTNRLLSDNQLIFRVKE